MKKWMIPGLLVLLMLPISAAGKQINIIGGVGFAFADVEGAMIELGVELQMVKGFFLQLTGASYLDDQGRGAWDDYIVYYGGMLHSPMRITSRPYSLDLYSVYKLRVSRKLKVFGKAGVHAAFYIRSYWDDFYNYSGPREDGVGTAFGIGMEHLLTERLAIVVGGTYKMLFDGGSTPAPGHNTRWFKLYIALNYNVNRSRFAAD